MYAFEWSPYLGGYPCIRVYDQNKWYYADVYCYYKVKRKVLVFVCGACVRIVFVPSSIFLFVLT